MRYPASEKAEIIRLVEQSPMTVKRTRRSSASRGPHFTAGAISITPAAPKPRGDRSPRPDRVWNRIKGIQGKRLTYGPVAF